MSQEEVSAKGKINRSYLSQVERGLKSPTVTMLLKICATIGASASELIAKLERSQTRKPPKNKP